MRGFWEEALLKYGMNQGVGRYMIRERVFSMIRMRSKPAGLLLRIQGTSLKYLVITSKCVFIVVNPYSNIQG